MQAKGGVLLLAPLGEEIVNRYDFLAAFTTVEEFQIIADGRPLGALPVDRPLVPGSYIIFAGRRWQVVECRMKERIIQVIPAAAGRAPMFSGLGGRVHGRVREQMRAILASTDPLSFLDSTARDALESARQVYRSLKLESQYILPWGDVTLMLPWDSDAAHDTIAAWLRQRNLDASNEGIVIRVQTRKPDQVHDAMLDLAEAPSVADAELLPPGDVPFQEKWEWLLPSGLLRHNTRVACSMFPRPLSRRGESPPLKDRANVDRTERFYKIDQLLRGSRPVSFHRMAEVLGVSPATVKRDLLYMRDRFNAPIEYDRAANGYQLGSPRSGPRYELPGLWFSASEVLALLSTLKLLSDLQPGLLGGQVPTLVGRLKAIAEEGDHSWEEIEKRIRIFQPERRMGDPMHFGIIAAGLLKRRRLDIRHYNRAQDRMTDRQVSPQRLVHYRDNWYLDAYCHLREDIRSFSMRCHSRSRAEGSWGEGNPSGEARCLSRVRFWHLCGR